MGLRRILWSTGLLVLLMRGEAVFAAPDQFTCGGPTISVELTDNVCSNAGVLHVRYDFGEVSGGFLFVQLLGTDGQPLPGFTASSETDAFSGEWAVRPGQWPGGVPGNRLRISAFSFYDCGVRSVYVEFTVPPRGACPVLSHPKFEFELPAGLGGQKLLLHKYLDSDHSGPLGNGYFSPYQVTDVPVDQPPQFRFSGAVTLDGAPVVRPVYYRVIDPPDTAPYVLNPAANDNRDPQHPKGTLFSRDASGTRVNGGGVQSSSDGVTGRATIYLEASNNVAGENYQLEASVDDPFFTCGTAGPGGTDICPRSVTVTTWKRVYLEVDTMFRQGAFLATAAAAGSRELSFHPNSPGEALPFFIGDTITLVHGGQSDFHQEDVEIDPAPVDSAGKALAPIEEEADGSWHVHLRSPLLHDYVGPTQTPRDPLWDRADAGGVQGSYFVPDVTLLSSFYADMFVDIQLVTDQPSSDFPFIEEFGDSQDDLRRLLLGRRFFYHMPPPGQPNRNIFHIIGAGNRVMEILPPANPNGQVRCRTNFGDTTAGTVNFSYIYVGNIELQAAGPIPPCTFQLPIVVTSIPHFTEAAVAHESVHQWRVNHNPGTTLGGHCNASAAVPPALFGDTCLMNVQWPASLTNWSQLNQPRLALHWGTNGADSEYTEVRTALEPVTH